MIIKPLIREIEEKNLIKYKGKPPSMEVVNACVEKAGLKYRYHFEKIYGIPEKTIERYDKGLRSMPVRYWHIFYEFDTLDKFYATFKIRKKRQVKEIAKREVQQVISSTNQSIIDAFRGKLNQR